MFLQQLINGLTLGGIYALIAVGYTMVYGIIQLINFAHGEVYMLGAFLTITFISAVHLSFWLALLLSLCCCAILGVIIDITAYRPLRNAPRLAALITAIGVSLFLQNLARMLWGPQTKPFPAEGLPEVFTTPIITDTEYMAMSLSDKIFVAHQIPLGATGKVSLLQLFILALTIILMIGLRFIVMKTKIGQAMRACAQDKITTSLMGIDVNRIVSFTFALGSAMGAVAGAFVGIFYNAIFPTMGYNAGVKAFAAAVLGGIGNILGAILGAFLLGLAEVFATAYISSQYKEAIAYLIMILVIIVRPSGLLGKTAAQRA